MTCWDLDISLNATLCLLFDADLFQLWGQQCADRKVVLTLCRFCNYVLFSLTTWAVSELLLHTSFRTFIIAIKKNTVYSESWGEKTTPFLLENNQFHKRPVITKHGINIMLTVCTVDKGVTIIFSTIFIVVVNKNIKLVKSWRRHFISKSPHMVLKVNLFFFCFFYTQRSDWFGLMCSSMLH